MKHIYHTALSQLERSDAKVPAQQLKELQQKLNTLVDHSSKDIEEKHQLSVFLEDREFEQFITHFDLFMKKYGKNVCNIIHARVILDEAELILQELLLTDSLNPKIGMLFEFLRPRNEIAIKIQLMMTDHYLMLNEQEKYLALKNDLRFLTTFK